jgi:chromosome partitioning protein
MTMFDARTNLIDTGGGRGKEIFSEIRVYRKYCARGTFASRRRRATVNRVMVYDPRSRGAEVYKELAKEVMERESETEREARPR